MKKTKELNSNNKIPRTNKGITLIALVITIIVMLILVAVTITMAVNGGLFGYAQKAGQDTNAAVANEQEFANLDAGMTVDNLIDKYTGANKGVDPNLLNIGDYVNYPVEYKNVGTRYNRDTGAEEGNYPRDEFIGWRVLSKETDEEGNVLYIKLISAGVPLGYYLYNDADTSVQALTTNFLTTEITSTLTPYRFCKCGFTEVTGTTLENTFANKFTDKVQALTKDELDKAVVDIAGPATSVSLKDPKFKDLLAIPCKGSESSKFAVTILATPTGNKWAMWGVNAYAGLVGIGYVSGYYGFAYGVRPVVSLKSGVQFKPATEEINETTTWDISI